MYGYELYLLLCYHMVQHTFFSIDFLIASANLKSISIISISPHTINFFYLFSVLLRYTQNDHVFYLSFRFLKDFHSQNMADTHPLVLCLSYSLIPEP